MKEGEPMLTRKTTKVEVKGWYATGGEEPKIDYTSTISFANRSLFTIIYLFSD